jgi:hypothetical protein
MRKLAFTSLILALLSGCAAPSAKHGNFVKSNAAGNDKTLAEDLAKKLATMYPAASTRFALTHATPDAFGEALVSTMRTKGYAVKEFAPTSSARSLASTTTSHTEGAILLAYILDQPMDLGLYRLTLLINNQSLSRMYQTKDGGIYPAGHWIRQE